MRNRMMLAVVAISVFIAASSFGATRTWTGTTNGQWTVAANWGGTAPVAGDDLVFPAGASNLSNTNDFPAGTSFNSITISGTGYTLAGNSITLGAGGLSSSAGGTVSLPITLGAGQTWSSTASLLTISGNVNLNGAPLTLNSAGGDGVISGVISGSGTIIKIGGGSGAGVDWRLSGSNTFTGQVQVTGGRLLVQNANALGVADNTLANGTVATGNGTLNFSALTFAPEFISIDGAGNSGNGVLQVAGSAILTGTMTLGTTSLMNVIVPGSVQFNGIVTGSGPFNMGGDGVYLLANSGNDFAGGAQFGGVQKATLTLSADNVLPDNVSLNIPALALFNVNSKTETITSISGAGSIGLGSGAGGTLTLTNPAGTFSGVISGIGTIVQSGGNITYSGANTYSGSYSHTGGSTTITGAMPANITQSAGSLTLSNNATTGAVSINGGSISPVSATTGNLALAAAATYNEAINGNTTATYSNVHVNGTVTLGGSTLSLSGTGAGVLPGNTLTIIDNDGVDPVAGTFAGLPEGAVINPGPGGLSYAISYVGGSGNDVVLTAAAATPVPAMGWMALLALVVAFGVIAVVTLNRTA